MSLPQTYKAIYSPAQAGGQPIVKDIAMPTLKNDEVLVKVSFASLTPIDMAVLKGFGRGFAICPGDYTAVYDRPTGYEGSGIVAAVGEDLKHPVKVGDKVYICGPGAYAEYVVLTSDRFYPIQEGVSLEDAASHYINPTTAHYIIQHVEEGKHKAVVHTLGASAIGRMLIKALKKKGIVSINIVRRNDFIEELKKDGADYVLNSTDADFDQQLSEIAKKEEATVAFDAISGDFSSRVLSALPPKSILYLYGSLSGDHGIKFIPMKDLFQQKKVTGLTDTTHLFEAQARGELRKVISEVQSLIPSIYISSVDKVFKLSDYNEAVAYFSKNRSQGKVLLEC